jgi:hypothetical protein
MTAFFRTPHVVKGKKEYFPDSVEVVAQRRFVTAVSQGYKPCESKESREVGNTRKK